MTLLRAIDRGFDRVLAGTGVLAAAIMLLLSVLVFLLSFSRYVLRINIPGLFDFAVYSLAVFPLLTAAYTMRAGQHIRVDILTSHLSKRTQDILNIPLYLMSLVYVVVLGWHGTFWVFSLLRRGVRTEGTLPIPQGILVSVMMFGTFLLIWQIVRVLVQNIRSVSRRTSSSPSGDNPWLYVSLLVVAIAISLLVLVFVNKFAGLGILAMVVLFSGMPIFLGLGLIGTLGIYFLLGPLSLMQVPMTAFQSMYSFPLTCLPLFILGGLIMEGSGIVDDIFKFFELWTRRSRVSPLLVTITVGLVFCAISGSSSATTAIIAAVAIPILVNRGYSKALSAGVVGGATVGTLIPPSIGYVVYGVLTGESIGRLFMAGLVPGLVLFVLYYLYIIVLGRVRPKSLFEGGRVPDLVSLPQVTWRERVSSGRTAVWGLLTPIIILGGIYAGVYTPTEAAGILVVYGIIVSVAVKRVSWRRIVQDTLRSALISSMILCIIFSAFIFAGMISQSRIAAALVAYVKAAEVSALGVIGVIFIVLLVLGCFLEAASLKVITLPLFYPIAMAVGIDSLWLGVFYQFLMEIGMLTPPVGLNLFVITGVSKMPIGTVTMGNLPFVVMMALTVVIIYFFPQLVTWLPSTMIKGP